MGTVVSEVARRQRRGKSRALPRRRSLAPYESYAAKPLRQSSGYSEDAVAAIGRHIDKGMTTKPSCQLHDSVLVARVIASGEALVEGPASGTIEMSPKAVARQG